MPVTGHSPSRPHFLLINQQNKIFEKGLALNLSKGGMQFAAYGASLRGAAEAIS
jgi:hypothetical protein